MNRPKRNEYPIVYYDDEKIKIAKNAREFPVWCEEYLSLKILFEKSQQYRFLNRKNMILIKYINIIKDILFDNVSNEEKLKRIKNTVYIAKGFKNGTKSI